MMEFLLIYVLPIYLFFTLTTKRDRDRWAVYFWLFVIASGVLGFTYQLITSGKFPAPCCG